MVTTIMRAPRALPSASSWPRWVWWATVGALSVGAAFTATACQASGGATEEVPPEQTAWDNRVELDRVLVETAEAAGVETTEDAVNMGTVACTRNDGRAGTSYFLQTLTAPGPVPDANAILDAVAAHWTSRGYAVDATPEAGVDAFTPNGAVLEASATRLGVRLAGQTLCALEDGAPSE